MQTSRFVGLVLIFAGLGLVAACSKKADRSDHAHGHDHHPHHHTAPHGGTLVELGDHQFNLELVRDGTTGTLTLYVLDAHAENFVRVALREIPLLATVDGMPRPLSLAATANTATGETVGDTSQFSGQAEWLKTAEKFGVKIPALEIRGAAFADVTFTFPEGSAHAH